MKLLILTTDPITPKWRTIKKKLSFFDKILASGKNSNFEPTEIKYIDIVPKVVNSKVDHAWMESLKKPYFSIGYDIIGLHMSEKQWKNWGIRPTLRGANPNGKTELENFYFSADENSKRNGLDRFEEVGGHELGHGYYDHSGEPDKVHEWHDSNQSIAGLFITFDWAKYQPERQNLKLQVVLLKKVIELLTLFKSKKKLTHPVEAFKNKVTQGYGVLNPVYTITGRHIGVDYGTPVGTPILAPADGEVAFTGNSKALGFWCSYKYVWNNNTYIERWAHLNKLPKRGLYRQGEMVAETGNTGYSTGPHLHQDIWQDRIKIEQINRSNWNLLTINPITHYAN